MSRSIIFITFLFFIACNRGQDVKTDNISLKEDTVTELRYVAKTPHTVAGCYSWTIGRDTATLQLYVREDQVKGTLAYDWSEKDRNSGTLQGVLQDSLVIANYTFQSEGMTLVREVVFKIKGDSLTEGFGDVNTVADTIKYKNKDQLKFETDRSFVRSACKE